jgi:hypothetical protein
LAERRGMNVVLFFYNVLYIYVCLSQVIEYNSSNLCYIIAPRTSASLLSTTRSTST